MFAAGRLAATLVWAPYVPRLWFLNLFNGFRLMYGLPICDVPFREVLIPLNSRREHVAIRGGDPSNEYKNHESVRRGS